MDAHSGLDFAESILFVNVSHILSAFDITLMPGDPRPARTADGDIVLDTIGAAAYIFPFFPLLLLFTMAMIMDVCADDVGYDRRVVCAPCILKPRFQDALVLITDAADAC